MTTPRQNITRAKISTGDDTVAWAVLAALVLLGVLAAPFFAGRIYTADDLGGFHLPLRAFFADRLAHGQPYDWMPQLFSGFYLTGEGQVGLYHPWHQLIYRVLPLRAALAWEYLSPYPIMMIGMWMLLKRRLHRGDAAMLGALVFTFSSFNLLHFVHPNAIAVVAHVPWLLWAIDVALSDSRRVRIAWATALIALLTGSQLLLGYPQFVWYSMVVETAYVVFLEVSQKYAARSGCSLCSTCDDCVGCTVQMWPRVVIAKGIGLLIGGIQILPTLDAWRHSARMAVDGQFAFWGSLHPLNVLQLVGPYLFADRVFGDSTHEFGAYLGAVPLVLVVWVCAHRRELGSLALLAWGSLGFALLMLLMSFGQFGFLYRITTWLPVVGGFRCPCRYLVLFQLAASVLAAIGFVLVVRESDAAKRQRHDPAWLETRRSWLALGRDFEPLWFLVGASAAVAIAGVKLRHEPYMASTVAILAGPALLLTAVILIVLAVRGRSAALIGLIVLAACDQGFYGLSYSSVRQSAPMEQFIASARTPPGSPDGRVAASLLRVDEPGPRTGDLMTLRGWSRADGYAGLEPGRQLDYRLLPSLRVAGVRWVRRNASTAAVAGLKPYGDDWLETPDPLPRVRLVTRTLVTTDPASDISRICPDTTALCEVPLSFPASKPGAAALTSDRPGCLEVDAECPAAQLLVVAESYHEGWRARVDGQPCPVYRINGDFMGCVISPGRHHVTLVFQPSSLQRGFVASTLGLGLLAVCFFGSLTGPKRLVSEEDLG
ncbi:MAG: YfhO family protein [Thermoguttaceae bacterium]